MSDAVTLFIRNHKAVLQAKSAKDYFLALQAFDLIRRPHRLEVFLQTLTLFYPSFNVARFRKLALSFLKSMLRLLLKRLQESRLKNELMQRVLALLKRLLTHDRT